ncbi:MAG: hypothetical protein QOJ60_2347 [Actinomycetota bacterium]|jgi:hypothetical protein|nr:hypothetical protein [Actinomycetota bacterium]
MVTAISFLVALAVVAAMVTVLVWTYGRSVAPVEAPVRVPRQRRGRRAARLGPDPLTDEMVSRGGLGVSGAGYRRYVERGLDQLADYLAEDPAEPAS